MYYVTLEVLNSELNPKIRCNIISSVTISCVEHLTYTVRAALSFDQKHIT